MSDSDMKPNDDTALAMLKGIAERADAQGHVRLHQSEIPFFVTTDGTRWLEQVSLDDDAYRLTEQARRALGLPTPPGG